MGVPEFTPTFVGSTPFNPTYNTSMVVGFQLARKRSGGRSYGNEMESGYTEINPIHPTRLTEPQGKIKNFP